MIRFLFFNILPNLIQIDSGKYIQAKKPEICSSLIPAEWATSTYLTLSSLDFL